MERDAGDIIDRWAIAKLKAERIGVNESKQEYSWFCRGIKELKNKHPEVVWDTCMEEILAIHAQIWDLESAVRLGKLDNNLEEVGRRAIQIRDWNKKRVALKNKINAFVGEGCQDIKQDHLSE
jgi:hypothetical protein